MCPIIMKFTLKSYCGKKNIVFKDNCRISVRSKVIFLFRLTLLGVLICGNKLLFFFFSFKNWKVLLDPVPESPVHSTKKINK